MEHADPALVTGHGQYINDINVPAALHLAILRSSHAHARVRVIETAAAGNMPDVFAVVTAGDLGDELRPIPPHYLDSSLLHPRGPWPLTQDVVRYVGEPVAAVLAASRYAAEDALEALRVEYEPLPAAADLDVSTQPNAPLVHADLPSNAAGRKAVRVGDPDAAFRAADVVVRLRLRVSRGHGQPLETRGCLAWYDQATDRLELIAAIQAPFRTREYLAAALGMRKDAVRVRAAPNVGGGFGLKSPVYPEEVLVALLARRTGRAVKWIEDRREHFLAAYHDREQIHELELAATRQGQILALRNCFKVDIGAYSAYGTMIANQTLYTMSGLYQIPNIDIAYTCWYSHRTPCGAYRGAGQPQGVLAIERALDALARELELDPLDVRRRNMIPAGAFPWRIGVDEVTYDSGDFPAIVEKAAVWREQLRLEATGLRATGRWAGVGIACYIKTTAYPGTESARVELDHSGHCTVYVSTPSQGQGHRHAWAKLVESELGIGLGQMRWVAGDTATLPVGTGTFASRSTATGGSAVQLAARELALKLKGAAAAMLECAAEDVVLIDGQAQVRGVPQRRIPLGVLVQRAAPGGALSAEHTFTSPGGHWPAGAQVALVEIDPETGCLRVRRLVAVDDCGRLLGPELVRGQVAGAAAQGIGNTVLERLVYDEAGQLLSGTFLDYPLPSAADVPPIDVEYLETPSPLNPLGVKGAGEGGIMPVAAVLSAAIDDAWQAAGVHAPLVDRLPILPEDLFRMRERPGNGQGCARFPG